MNWNHDDIGYFARLGLRSASVWRDGRRWAWAVFAADGSTAANARSHSLSEAQGNAEVMMRRT